MDPALSRQLSDKIYEKRKAAAMDLEKLVRECHQRGEYKRTLAIIDQCIEMFSNSSNAIHIRNGGLIGLAGASIALGPEIAPHLDRFIHQVLLCFVEPENKMRYFAAECLYNLAKSVGGEILVYFNDIFDALSKLSADAELSVRNGAELNDRLLKDMVSEFASIYVPIHPRGKKQQEKEQDQDLPVLVDVADISVGHRKAFSLQNFIPLLRDRMGVSNPYTRQYLISWISTLASVPELELITYLPEFLEGLIVYLSDPGHEVREAATILLADLLRDIHEVTSVSRQLDQLQAKKARSGEHIHVETVGEEGGDHEVNRDASHDATPELVDRDLGTWVPGQGVKVDFKAIMDILLGFLSGDYDEIAQSTALDWIYDFLSSEPEMVVSFAPELILGILPNLAHHAESINRAAIRAHKVLYGVVQAIPTTPDPPTSPGHTQSVKSGADKSAPTKFPRSPTPTLSGPPGRQSTIPSQITRDNSSPDIQQDIASPPRSRSGTVVDQTTPRPSQIAETTVPGAENSRSDSPVASLNSQSAVHSSMAQSQVLPEDSGEPFDYNDMLKNLLLQFASEFEETRVASLKWVIMLHKKVPQKISAMDHHIFPALLSLLSDPCEEVVKKDLQLLAQISASSEEVWFKAFMRALLQLFSTDQRMFETRGSLIIRQLCTSLSTEKIYKTLAEILEKEDDLEFASVIVQKLNIILATSPELADFRRRLKSLETRQDGQALFTTLYRSWCHNAVSVFSLCLLAQAYEHASNLLHTFAELEITVPMLVQIDKLVQLIESPVFTYLRLQLLEPEKHPYLFKCLYGLLMLLPQSSAFAALRNRLNAVNSAGFLQVAPRTHPGSTIPGRTKIGRDEIKWQELLQHFRQVQARHEKARRQASGVESTALPDNNPVTSEFQDESKAPKAGVGRIPMRRRVTGGDLGTTISAAPPGRAGALSPLNPAKGRAPTSMTGLAPSLTTTAAGVVTNNNAAAALAQRTRRAADFGKK